MPNLAMATDAILAAFHEAWADRYPVEWPNHQPDGPKLSEGDSPWARVTIRHEGSDQASLGEVGGRVFTREGTVTVQVFVPSGKRGLIDADELAMVATNAYEGKTHGGVRFYRVGAKTVGHDGPWFQVNAVADFEFDEVK